MKTLTILFILCARLCAGQINCDSAGANLPTDTTVCLGDTVKFTISGAESYTWTISGVTWINEPDNHVSTFAYAIPWSGALTVRYCTKSRTINIHVIDCPVGIKEILPNQCVPIYFDLYGNKIPFVSDQILIEQRGNYRRKVYQSL